MIPLRLRFGAAACFFVMLFTLASLSCYPVSAAEADSTQQDQQTASAEESASSSSVNEEVDTAPAATESSTHGDNDADENVVTWEDTVEDSLYDPLQADPDCAAEGGDGSCWSPPATTVEEHVVSMDASCSFGGDDPDQDGTCDSSEETTQIVDQHWGSDPQILRMRNKLRDSGSGVAGLADPSNRRPPIFLMPGLASTRLVAWRYKACPHHPLLSDIKVLDYGR